MYRSVLKGRYIIEVPAVLDHSGRTRCAGDRGDDRLTYNFVHSNGEVRAPTTSFANSKILRVPSTKTLCRKFTILRLLGKPRPSCLSLGGGHEGAKGVETNANITGYRQNPSRHGAAKQWQILVPTATPQLCGGTEWRTVATQCNSP